MTEANKPHLDATRAYYDEFSTRYDDKRGGRVRGGYHDLLDDLELRRVGGLRLRQQRGLMIQLYALH